MHVSAPRPFAEPMRDWTGIDSLVSPAACLLAMALVWAFERIFPQVDLLFFVPKEWRTQEPLYQLDEVRYTGPPGCTCVHASQLLCALKLVMHQRLLLTIRSEILRGCYPYHHATKRQHNHEP